MAKKHSVSLSVAQGSEEEWKCKLFTLLNTKGDNERQLCIESDEGESISYNVLNGKEYFKENININVIRWVLKRSPLIILFKL